MSAQAIPSPTGQLRAVLTERPPQVQVTWQGKPYTLTMVRIHPRTGKERRIEANEAELRQTAAKVQAFLDRMAPAQLNAADVQSLLISFTVKRTATADTHALQGISYRPTTAPDTRQVFDTTGLAAADQPLLEAIGQDLQDLVVTKNLLQRPKPSEPPSDPTPESTPAPAPAPAEEGWWERFKRWIPWNWWAASQPAAAQSP